MTQTPACDFHDTDRKLYKVCFAPIKHMLDDQVLIAQTRPCTLNMVSVIFLIHLDTLQKHLFLASANENRFEGNLSEEKSFVLCR